jgi:Protein of unknown function (DUF3047)
MAGSRLVAGLLCAAVVLLPSTLALAEELAFGPDLHQAGWRTVTFPGIAPASFKAAGRTSLEVSTDSGAGLLCRMLGKTHWQSRKARWRWRVRQGAPATDLTMRGADDRALGVYFVFGAIGDADRSPTGLLGSATVTALVYVFGGDKARGRMLPSPHMGERGKFMVLRPADAQKSVWLDEDVDLAADHLRAFARPASLLLAVIIMSDSDDTRTRNRADIEGLNLN